MQHRLKKQHLNADDTAWPCHQWGTQGHWVFWVFDHQTPSPGQPNQGMISSWLVFKQHTKPWISSFNLLPLWSLLHSFTDVLGGFTLRQTSNSKEFECLLLWKSSVSHLNGQTTGLPTILAVGLYKLKITGLLLLMCFVMCSQKQEQTGCVMVETTSASFFLLGLTSRLFSWTLQPWSFCSKA